MFSPPSTGFAAIIARSGRRGNGAEAIRYAIASHRESASSQGSYHCEKDREVMHETARSAPGVLAEDARRLCRRLRRLSRRGAQVHSKGRAGEVGPATATGSARSGVFRYRRNGDDWTHDPGEPVPMARAHQGQAGGALLRVDSLGGKSAQGSRGRNGARETRSLSGLDPYNVLPRYDVSLARANTAGLPCC